MQHRSFLLYQVFHDLFYSLLFLPCYLENCFNTLINSSIVSSPSPCLIASLTQWLICLSVTTKPTFFNADWIALICTKISTQYRSSSTIFCIPRTCPSIRFKRLMTFSFSSRVLGLLG